MRWSLALVLVGLLAVAGTSCTGETDDPGRRRDNAASQKHDGGAAGTPWRGTNLVLVSVDTLRRDHLQPYGAGFRTPTATALAAEGVLFEKATAHTPLTLPSHATMLTGLYPTRHGVRDNGGFVLAAEHRTLAEVLGEAGYATAAFVASYTLDAGWGLAQGFDVYDDDLGPAPEATGSAFQAQRPASEVVDAATQWLERELPDGRPFFLWVHLFDPHLPHAAPAEHRRAAPDAYSAEVAYADAEVGRLLGALQRAGVRERTAIIYTSDHGEGLGEHGEPAHGVFLYGSTLDVPLIVSLPPATGVPAPAGRVAELARLVDLTPTVLDLLGLPLPEGLDGTSLRPLIEAATSGPGEVDGLDATASDAAGATSDDDGLSGPLAYAESYYARLHYGWSELLAVRTGRWKYIRAPRRELYDLALDPGETENLLAGRPRLAAALDAEIEAVNALVRSGAAPAPAATDPETAARLRSLGYLGSAAPAAAARAARLPDPKDRLPLLLELQRADDLEESGELGRAAELVEELARRDPANPEVHSTRLRIHLRRDDAGAAIEAGERLLQLRPDDPLATNNLAVAYREAGRYDEAASRFRRAVELDPTNATALLNLAQLAFQRREVEQAAAWVERAAQLTPDSAEVQLERSRIALAGERLDTAEAALHRALELGADAPGLRFNLALIAERRGDVDDAARHYRAEVDAHPDSLEAWVNLGVLERERGRLETAVAAFEGAAGADASRSLGPFLVAETLAALGRTEEARRWAEEAVARDPGDQRARRLLQRLQ